MGACGRGGGRVWGHVAGVGIFGRGSGLWHGWGHVGVGACGRVWGHVAGVVAGCGGMWQGLGYLVGGQAYGMDADMWLGWGHVVGCKSMWQGVWECAGVVAGCWGRG